MRETIRSFQFAFLCLLLLPGASCYRLVPGDASAPAIGRELVLELSERGAIELAPQLGSQLRSVTGRVIDFRGDVYRVAVTQTNSRGGVETLWRGEEASIPRPYVRSVGERRLDKRRTWLVSALTALGIVLAGEAFGIDTPVGGIFGSRGGGTPQ